MGFVEAVAVVKRKPNDLKVKPYVSGLKQQLHLKDGIWNKKKKKFLECQQEWMSKALPVDIDLDAEVAPFSKECVSLSKFQTHERYLHLMKNVSIMGESALKSHSKSEKHKQNSRCEQLVTLSSFGFGSSAGTSTCSSRNKEACVVAGTSTCASGNMEARVEGSQQQAGRLNIPPPPDEIATPASQQSMRGFSTKDDVLKVAHNSF
ncbi:hypothetical protein AWC38_SpisGene12246 [Stylophora pistillata]|uniref:Uncharacterized protein n=1 Tax=Stylophora pistillata TaxID=50429 RepID=A0A2B4S2F8_STYPI|nr:hypothetical protein AWC38_SpisGene12246 [Stylophora pistillata]